MAIEKTRLTEDAIREISKNSPENKAGNICPPW
jgi:hypothetical protein